MAVALMGLGLDAWWDEPAYKTRNTFHLRGLFIFDKLKQHDATKFHDVITDLYGSTRRTLARLNGKPSSPSWARASRRLRMFRRGWDGSGVKRRNDDPESPYVGGRTLKWLKVKQAHYREGERGWEPKG